MKNKTGLEERIEKYNQEIKEYIKLEEDNKITNGMMAQCSCVMQTRAVLQELLAEEKAELSLAELADEKGMFVDISREKTGWDIEIVNKRTGALFESITGKTYAEAEQKAKLYLEGLK